MLHLGGSFTKSGAEERAVRGHEGGGALGCRFKGPECGDAGGHDFVRSCALGMEATRVNQARVQPYCGYYHNFLVTTPRHRGDRFVSRYILPPPACNI